jgi:hypothetical protein
MRKIPSSDFLATEADRAGIEGFGLHALCFIPGNGLGQSQLVKRGRQIAEELSTETLDKAKATLMALLCRVTILKSLSAEAVLRNCLRANRSTSQHSIKSQILRTMMSRP